MILMNIFFEPYKAFQHIKERMIGAFILLSLVLIFSHMDVNIWYYILLAFGISYLTGIDRKKSGLISFMIFVIYMLISILTKGRGRWSF